MLQDEPHGETPEQSQTDKVVNFPLSVDQRLDQAIALFDKGNNLARVLKEFLSLIDEGNEEAYYFAGCIYEEGADGVEQDLGKAMFYYKKSVETLGYVEGYLALGRLYYYGIGVNQDYAKAFEYYSAVGAQKDNTIANLMLGTMYHYGFGINQNPNKAKEYYSKAAIKDNVYAIRNLGVLESEQGHLFRGFAMRLKAGILAFRIGTRNMNDKRLRRA